MARPLRVELAGGCYHVINRGNYRAKIFAGQGAAEAFVRTLDEAAVRYDWRVHAYGKRGRQVLTLDKAPGYSLKLPPWRDRCGWSLQVDAIT